MDHNLLYLMCVLGVLNIAQSCDDCSMKRTSSLRFSVKSTVNELGERIVLVNGLGEARETGTVGVSVEHWTANCHHMQVVGLQLNVTGPTSGIDAPPVTEIHNSNVGLSSTTPLPALNCLPGYQELAGFGCYKFVNKMFTWDEARRFCEAEDTHLAIPDTDEELYELRVRMSVRYKADPWVGIKKSGASWITVKGGDKSWGWGPHYPKGTGNCVGVGCFGLMDYNCNARGSFVCEQNQVRV